VRYVGGKNRIRKQVARYPESVQDGKIYFEPFCGGNWEEDMFRLRRK
jgi:site-specific DNA-adenine methylase